MAKKKVKKSLYAFPTRSTCPRCRSANTIAYSTHDGIQHRKCLVAVCGKHYIVRGKEIKPEPKSGKDLKNGKKRKKKRQVI